MTQADLDSLRICVLFRDLTEEFILHKLLPLGTLRLAAKGQFLLVPQKRLDSLCVVLSGRIQTQHLFSDGSYSITDVLTAGEVFGADLVCTHSRLSPYHAFAAEPCRLLCFPCEVFLHPGALEESARQQVLARLLALISNLNMQKEYRLAILSQKGLRQRILTYLQMQAGKRRTSRFTVPFSREELASFLCVNRSALSHELSCMAQEGLIAFRKNEFTLLTAPD